MRNILVLATLLTSFQSSIVGNAKASTANEPYRNGGEWETVTQIVDLELPETLTEEKELILKLYRDQFGDKTVIRECLEAIPALDYPKPGDELDLKQAGSCTFEKVESPGDAVQRYARCSGDNLESELHISGYHTSTKYEYLMKMVSSSITSVTAISKESGVLIGPCKFTAEKEQINNP